MTAPKIVIGSVGPEDAAEDCRRQRPKGERGADRIVSIVRKEQNTPEMIRWREKRMNEETLSFVEDGGKRMKRFFQ